MSNDDETTPHRRGGISLDERLERIEAKLDRALEAEGAILARVARIEDKTALHDRVIMSVCAVIGVTVIGALLVKVIH